VQAGGPGLILMPCAETCGACRHGSTCRLSATHQLRDKQALLFVPIRAWHLFLCDVKRSAEQEKVHAASVRPAPADDGPAVPLAAAAAAA
jgi:hypothetical protein